MTDEIICLVAHIALATSIYHLYRRFGIQLTPMKRPLQWFRSEPEKKRDINTNLYMAAMNEVKRKMEEGTAIACTATYGFAKQKELGFDDIELAYALSAPWAAGIGTVSPSPNSQSHG